MITLECIMMCWNINKLGLYSSVYIEECGVIVNAYTQHKFGTDKRYCDYDAIANVMKLMNDDFNGKHFCILRISCDLAGGDWNIIEEIINKNTPDVKFTVYSLI